MFSYLATDKGPVRPVNEDSAAVFEPCVYVVADGMGGQAAGEVASQLLVKVVRQELEGKAAVSETQLKQAVLAANAEILHTARSFAGYQGMGTTVTMLHVNEQAALASWAHVGDSRLYLCRDGVLSQMTQDHTYVESLVAKGELTEAEARVHPKKNMLLRAVGVDEHLLIDTGSFAIRSGDVLLLATDGLMKSVSDAEIATVLTGNGKDTARILVDMALAAGARDNVTVVVVEDRNED